MDTPEIGHTVLAAGIRTNYHDQGTGRPVLLLHGSGPGVSAWANWRLVLPRLAAGRRVLAPDMVGFGYTDRPANLSYGLDTWVRHAVGFLDAMRIDQADLVGNSFGGALALALAIRHPARVRKLVLMGSVGLAFDLTPGLDLVWGYEPSVANMRRVLQQLAFDPALVTDELAQLRYQASVLPGVQEAYSAMFPAPRQARIRELASRPEDVAALPHETLVLHGREDRVIPVSVSIELSRLIQRSQLHVFGQCGHWTQIEQQARFCRLVGDFLDEA